jgi:hypothetical protein
VQIALNLLTVFAASISKVIGEAINMERKSLVSLNPSVNQRQVKTVPYVELFARRMQGVVSSKSDIKRVYVSFIEAETLNYSCSTNNNRPCGGLRGGCCKHILELVNEAMQQFGKPRLINYMKLGLDPNKQLNGYSITSVVNSKGTRIKAPSGMVFSRFLDYLSYFELPKNNRSIPEMAWFVAG